MDINNLATIELKREREQFEHWYMSLMMIFKDNPTQREVIRATKKVLWEQWLQHKPERDSHPLH